MKGPTHSVTPVLEPQDALRATASEELDFVDNRPPGGAWVLDHLRHQMGIGQAVKQLLAESWIPESTSARRLGRQPRFGAARQARRHQVGVGFGLHSRAARGGRRQLLPAMDFLLECGAGPEERTSQAQVRCPRFRSR